jgi:hypothetical protein
MAAATRNPMEQGAHVAPFESAVGAFDAPDRRVRVRRGGDERSVYPHDGMRLQPALFGHAEAVLQQPDGVTSEAGHKDWPGVYRVMGGCR